MAREQIRLTGDEFNELRDEVGRILFVQYGLRNRAGFVPGFGGKDRLANGIARDLNIFIENLMTDKIYGVPEYKERKQ